LEAASNQSRELRQQVQDQQAQIASLAAALDHGQVDRAAIETEWSSARDENAELLRRIQMTDARSGELDLSLELARTELDELRASLAEKRDELDKTHASLDELTTKAEDQKHEASKLKSELAQRSFEAEEVGNGLVEAKHQIEKLKQDLVDATARSEAVEAERELIRAALKQESADLEVELHRARDHHREHESFAKARIEVLEAELGLEAEKMRAGLAGQYELQQSIKKRDVEARLLEESLAEADQQIALLMQLVDTSQSERDRANTEREAFERDFRDEKIRLEQDLRAQFAILLTKSREDEAAVVSRIQAMEAALTFASDQARALSAEKAALQASVDSSSAEIRLLSARAAHIDRKHSLLTQEMQTMRATNEALTAERDELRRDRRVETLRIEQEKHNEMTMLLRVSREHQDATALQIKAMEAELKLADEQAKAFAGEKIALKEANAARLAKKRHLEVKLARRDMVLSTIKHKALQTEDRLRAQLEAALHASALSEAAARSFLDSSSWRLTAPLRRLSLIYRRIRK
ncbi:MAG: hypothetical protein ACRC7G_14245, partial [Beijerinckiaceae bacterium]